MCPVYAFPRITEILYKDEELWLGSFAPPDEMND